MLSDNRISKSGLIGALIGVFASVFSHKSTDSRARKFAKSGIFAAAGYIIGSFTGKKFDN